MYTVKRVPNRVRLIKTLNIFCHKLVEERKECKEINVSSAQCNCTFTLYQIPVSGTETVRIAAGLPAPNDFSSTGEFPVGEIRISFSSDGDSVTVSNVFVRACNVPG